MIALQVNAPVVVALGTATMLQCQSPEVPVAAATVCRATVTNTGSAAQIVPTGGIHFASDGNGSFSSDSCSLSGGACQVTYTPAAVGSGTHHLTASYGGDSAEKSSDATAAVRVTRRDTAMSLHCGPDELRAGQRTTCTATVADIDLGTPSPPTGKVIYSSNGPGVFEGDCVLASAATTTATCSVTYVPTSDRSPHPVITATYGGNSRDEPSGPVMARLTVVAP